LNPLTQAWGWQNSTHVPLGRDHALIYLGTGVGVPTWTHIVVNEAGDIYGEYPPMNPRPGIYVDTKDFAMPADRYIDAIKVDWEPLFPGTILKVSCLAREGINDGVTDGPVFGTIGFEQNLSNLFAHVPACQQCELSPGGSENALRARGKYNRFRFEVLGGLARIRGFAFRQSMASDRLTNVRIIVTPIDRGVWDQTGWDQSNWNAN
jgi:hypothetical protein